MYKQQPSKPGGKVSIELDGQQLAVPEGISVAAAVLGHGDDHHCRCSVIGGEKRAPYCLIGVCHECLMEIDGKPYQQACLVTVREGMKVNKQLFKGGETHAK
ncbi:MAG: (2Fe-2S)-binding protein [Desulfobacterales bacterium]|nr:(2Fe-2S)-binding protein [Desulfobacterales bacterium]